MNFGGIDFTEEMNKLRETPDTIDGLDINADDEIDWDNLPEAEKVSEEELDYMEASEVGKWDGVNDALNKRVNDALSEKDGEKLHALRKDVQSGKFAEQFVEGPMPDPR